MCKQCPSKSLVPPTPSTPVVNPAHYDFFPNISAIKVIASSMTEQQYYGFCLGNSIKYRLRVGMKDDVMQEIGKADNYIIMYNKYVNLCMEN